MARDSQSWSPAGRAGKSHHGSQVNQESHRTRGSGNNEDLEDLEDLQIGKGTSSSIAGEGLKAMYDEQNDETEMRLGSVKAL